MELASSDAMAARDALPVLRGPLFLWRATPFPFLKEKRKWGRKTQADEYPQGAGRICNASSSRTAALGLGLKASPLGKLARRSRDLPRIIPRGMPGARSFCARLMRVGEQSRYICSWVSAPDLHPALQATFPQGKAFRCGGDGRRKGEKIVLAIWGNIVYSGRDKGTNDCVSKTDGGQTDGKNTTILYC